MMLFSVSYVGLFALYSKPPPARIEEIDPPAASPLTQRPQTAEAGASSASARASSRSRRLSS